MDGTHRACVSGIHGLQHIDDFSTTTFANDNPVRTHPQRVFNQFSRTDESDSLVVGRAGFESDHVSVSQLKLCGILNRDDSLTRGNVLAENIEQGGLT